MRNGGDQIKTVSELFFFPVYVGSDYFSSVLVVSCGLVLSSDELDERKAEKQIFTDQRPEKVLQELERRGQERVLLAGGGKANSSFMKEGLVDEIMIDLMPEVLGKGVDLFSPEDFRANLELEEVEEVSESEVRLLYSVRSS
jgi:riboflavin biosynthesis pyrimidine reductase